ncbi:MAG: hypothetical protein JWN03_4087 [Nocardia sp.]|nr:hypothetical protein [Nocardia sp.]
MIQKIEHVFFEYERETYSRWDDLDATEYVERNCGREILSEDRQILEFAIAALNENEYGSCIGHTKTVDHCGP